MRVDQSWERLKNSVPKCIQTEEPQRIFRIQSLIPQFLFFQMLNEFLQDQAALYAAGTITPQEREQCELLLEFNSEFRAFLAELEEVSVNVILAIERTAPAGPSAGLKAHLSDLLASLPQHSTPEAMVMSGPDGLVQWVNLAFSTMCGYTLEELRGKKLGPILQGAKTDPETAARMRRAVREYQPCRETILNYHKNGTPYWVEVAITPILNDAGRPLWLFARERELTDRIAA